LISDNCKSEQKRLLIGTVVFFSN